MRACPHSAWPTVRPAPKVRPPTVEGMDALRLTRHADVLAILSDTRVDVVVAPAGETGIGWWRATVARFSTGTAHARRRGYAMAALRGIEPGRLRSRARHLAASHPSGRGGGWLSALPVTV